MTTRDARRLGLRFRHGLHALLSVQPSACLMVRGWVSCVVWLWFAGLLIFFDFFVLVEASPACHVTSRLPCAKLLSLDRL